jgi:heme-degrading monooxygenase HmoA
MKKALIIALIILLGSAGFLAYDWHVKTTIQQDDQRVTLYSWTDEKGAKHYTNTQPPDGAQNVEESKGYKYVEPPLVIKIKDKAGEIYGWVKKKIFRPRGNQRKRGK